MNKNLVSFIRANLLLVKSPSEITTELLQKGWTEKDITEAFIEAKKITIPPVPSPPKQSDLDIIDISHLSASKVLLFLGGLIIVLAGILYIGINWSGWESAARIGAILLPIIILDMTAFWLWNSKSQKNALAFITAGSLLFPFFLVVTFSEISFLKTLTNWQTGFFISTATLALYLFLSAYFISPTWSLLSPLTGLFAYFFLLRVIDLEKMFSWPVEAWAFLIPALFLIAIAYYYYKLKLEDRSTIVITIGSLASAIALLRLITYGFGHEETSWLALLPLIGYFALAVYFEKQSQIKNCLPLYFVSLLGFSFDLAKLAMSGNILHTLPGTSIINQTDKLHVGGSIIIAGLIFMGVVYLLKQMQSRNFNATVIFNNFFEFIGTFAILGGIFFLGTSGKEFVYETLLLIVSLGFVFGSIIRQSRIFLYVGTLFLVVYIFDIGSEYFQNQVGWPITLFTAGLISMGIGLAMERIKRKFFSEKAIGD